MKIVFATGNPHKLEEIKAIAKALGNEDIEFIIPPDGFDPVEDGETFEENALIKAKAANKITGLPSLGDDSGLCVEVLDGAPGLYSARYAETPQARIDKLLSAMEPHKNRNAKFICALTLVDETGEKIFSSTGECHGEIAHYQSGSHGFGYDPIFIIENSDKTMAELSENEKNMISHRARAMKKVLGFLKNLG